MTLELKLLASEIAIVCQMVPGVTHCQNVKVILLLPYFSLVQAVFSKQKCLNNLIQKKVADKSGEKKRVLILFYFICWKIFNQKIPTYLFLSLRHFSYCSRIPKVYLHHRD